MIFKQTLTLSCIIPKQAVVVFTSMGRIRRDCPVCDKKGLLRLPNHLRCMHGLNPQQVMASAPNDITDDDITDDEFTDDDITDNASMESASEDTEDSEDDGLISDASSDEESDTDNVWYQSFVRSIFETFQDDIDDKVTELKEDDMSTDEAKETALAEFLPAMNKDLQKRIKTFCRINHELKKDPIFMKIMDTAKTARQDDNMDWEESIAYALSKRSFLLDKVLGSWDIPLGEEMDEDSD